MRLFALSCALISFSTQACPNLAGTYKVCRSANGQVSETHDLVITQKVENKITIYTTNAIDSETGDVVTETLKADGKTVVTTQSDPDTGLTIKNETTASCDGNTLKMKAVAKFDNEVLAEISTKIVKQNNSLVQTYTGTGFGQPVSDTVTCE